MLAMAIHEDYLRRRRADGSLPSDDPALRSWDVLDESLRASNRDQAADIARKLGSIGCEAVFGTDGKTVEFEPEEIETLPRAEHVRWVEDRLRQGWRRGPHRDVAGKLSPYLAPWEELSEAVRDLDRDSVRAIPRLLDNAGLTIVRRTRSQGPD